MLKGARGPNLSFPPEMLKGAGRLSVKVVGHGVKKFVDPDTNLGEKGVGRFGFGSYVRSAFAPNGVRRLCVDRVFRARRGSR